MAELTLVHRHYALTSGFPTFLMLLLRIASRLVLEFLLQSRGVNQ